MVIFTITNTVNSADVITNNIQKLPCEPATYYNVSDMHLHIKNHSPVQVFRTIVCVGTKHVSLVETNTKRRQKKDSWIFLCDVGDVTVTTNRSRYA